MNYQFISTAIPYVNAAPHIGFALELLLADVIARHQRLRGTNTYFLSGTDDHSLKNALAAEALRQPTREFVRERTTAFAALKSALNLSYDDFLSTSTDPRHAPAVTKLWHACADRGDIHIDRYAGLYCVGCEQFYAEQELTDGLCPEHRTPPERVCEQNYFFCLERYQDEILDRIRRNEIAIRPRHRKNEILAFLNTPLHALSISRSVERARGWGITVPDDPTQVIYVWFDALANYISALGYAKDSESFNHYWTNAQRVSHVLGKGVTRFHAVYWPAILLSAGIRLPTDILVHGYVTVDREKISKSLGNTISPVDACKPYGIDALRYFLLRHIGTHRDGDFSWPRFGKVYEQELANDLGNLVSRFTALVRRYGTPPQVSSPLAQGLAGEVAQCIDEFALHTALEKIWQAISATNAYISRTEPWKLAKQGKASAAGEIIGEVNTTLQSIASALRPFLPETADRLDATLKASSPALLFPREPMNASAHPPRTA